jgi:hypothetical protein
MSFSTKEKGKQIPERNGRKYSEGSVHTNNTQCVELRMAK